jgi:hypothetical protein
MAEIIGQQEVMKFFSVVLETHSAEHYTFANVAGSLEGGVSAVSLEMFLFGLLTVGG